MHYHVTRQDYDSRLGHDLKLVEVGIAPTFPAACQLQDEDSKQFRVPSADRWIWHDWCRRSCSADHS